MFLETDSEGMAHLRWIWRFQVVLLPLGSLGWGMESFASAGFFLAGGLASMAAWQLHKWAVGRMLSPRNGALWFFGLLGIIKLALIAFFLRVTIGCFPGEALPFVTGIFLSVAAILLEAARLTIGHFRPPADGGDQP